jgi:NitT/TauT family transport system substrate-binding protein
MDHGIGIDTGQTMKKNIAAIAAFAAITLVGLGAWYFTNSGATSLGTAEPLIIGGPALEQSAFIYIAEDQGYFARNGLNVTIRDDYPSGVGPVSDMMLGRLDISTSSEYPVIAQVFSKKNISIIGTIDKYQNEEIICRRDRGIENISDLKWKKIGLPKKTICEFFLGRFLNLHSMSLHDVALMDLPASQSVDAVTNGSVDAIIYYQPYVYAIEDRLDDNGVTWQAQSNQLLYGVMSCRNDWAVGHGKQINRLLKSLAMAEEYIIDHPEEAKAIVQKRLNFSDAYMETVWPNHEFTLALDQSLLIAMNDEGRWMINNNLTTEKTLPYFRDYIYTKGLEEIKPESVNIR